MLMRLSLQFSEHLSVKVWSKFLNIVSVFK